MHATAAFGRPFAFRRPSRLRLNGPAGTAASAVRLRHTAGRMVGAVQAVLENRGVALLRGVALPMPFVPVEKRTGVEP